MNIKIIVATHKPYKMPKDPVYLPLHVGREGKSDIGFAGDNTGENISKKNPYYCELTGLYWAWKNLPDADVIGLVHYRRHFMSLENKSGDKWDKILGGKGIEKIMQEYDIIVPKKRNYYIETIYSHYANTHDSKHLDFTRDIIKEYSPQYLDSFDTVMKSTSTHMFNILIMKKKLFHSYCEWLFSILEQLEPHISVEKLSSFEARLFGRVGELLLDVWINKNKLSYTEIKCLHMEKINWVNKIKYFLLAKIANKKYDASF